MTEPTFSQERSFFSLTCRVQTNIRAKAESIWKLLTDAQDFPRWNSTVTNIEGRIREGEKLKVRVRGSDRTFNPTVSGIVPCERMIWTGGFAPLFKGIRTFELKARNDSSTDFAMEERFSGLMLPLLRRTLPDFGPVFARYATNLKTEAERIASGA